MKVAIPVPGLDEARVTITRIYKFWNTNDKFYTEIIIKLIDIRIKQRLLYAKKMKYYK